MGAKSGSTVSASRMVARLYDALHDPKFKEVLTTATDTGSEGYTHRYFRAPTTWEEQLAARDAVAAWARLTYGWLGRSPDYKGAFLGTLGANATPSARNSALATSSTRSIGPGLQKKTASWRSTLRRPRVWPMG